MDGKKMLEIEKAKINLQIELTRRQNWVSEAFTYTVIVIAVTISFMSLFSDFQTKLQIFFIIFVAFIFYYKFLIKRIEKKCDAKVEAAYTELAKLIDAELLKETELRKP